MRRISIVSFLILTTAAAILPAQDITPPSVATLLPPADSATVRLREIEVFFSEDVQGVEAADLLINSVPATNVFQVMADQYRFQFAEPATGVVQVTWIANHGIMDLAASPNPFAGGSWNYTLNPALALFQVRINEFMADNETGIRDEDGTFQDWIEIYNGSPIPVNLQGCYLTDRKDNLDLWRFPEFTLPPNTYLIVWASGKDRTNLAALHTSFRLDPDPPGEYLALVDPTGTNVISAFDPAYPAQRPNISYGRDPLDPGIVGFYSRPTPGTINSTTGSAADFAPDVAFSRASGTFVEAFDLTLSTSSSNAVIRYVLVNSAATAGASLTNVPSTNSPIYTGPIRIDLTTEVRVRAFEPGKLPGTPVTASYIWISPNVVSFNSDLPLIIVHNFAQSSTLPNSTDQQAIFASFHADLDRSSLTNTPDLVTRSGANDRGSSTGGQPKQNMAIEFWDEFNQDTDYPLLGMPAESDWVLYGINGFDPGMMHNAIFYWFGRVIGRYSARTRYAEVFRKTAAGPIGTNDYLGVYLVIEKPKRNQNRVNIEALQIENTNAPAVTGGYLLTIDRQNDPGEVGFRPPQIGSIGPTPEPISYVYPDGIQLTTDARRRPQTNYIQRYILNFLTNLASANYTHPVTGYVSYIDVDSWVENHIANVLCYNVDGYRLSGYFFKDRDKRLEQGPPWDCDRCMGTGGSGTTPQTDGRCFNPREWRRPATSIGQDNGTDFFGLSTVGVSWWQPLFRDPNFWQKWIDRYQQYRTNEFTLGAVSSMIDGFYEEIKEAQPRDQARWSGSFTYPRSGNQSQNGYSYSFGPPDTRFARGGFFTNEVNFQKQWFVDRLDFIDTNFLAMPVLTNGTSLVANGTTITVRPASKPGTILYYTLDGTDPRLPGGSISPTALSSAGNLTLTISGNVRLFARCYNAAHSNLFNVGTLAAGRAVGNPLTNSHWSGPVAATFYTSVPPLRITEIMYHPAEPPAGNTNDQDNFEYVEVKNIGTTPLNVNGFRLRGGVDFEFPNGSLAAGEYAVIVKNVAAFQARYGTGPRILGSYTNDNLANEGDNLVLEGGFGEPILDFSYSDAWYHITDGPGFSLQIVNENAATDTWGLSTSWRPSGVANGTPGAADPGATAVAAVYVNEALPHTDPSPTDAIELHNSTGSPVNVGGWFLTDSFGTPKKYRIPDNTMIPANGFIVFNQATSFGVGANGFALSSRGEEVFVFSADAAGNLTGWHHGFDFGAQANGVTFGRHVISTGADHLPSQTIPTLGAANSGPKVGPIVISEVNYHPPDLVFPLSKVDNTIDEYIELHNLSASDVPLYDPANPANVWRLREAVSFTFPANVVIPAGGYLLVVSFSPADAAALASFRAVNNVPLSTPVYGPWSGQLDNAEDSVELERPDLPDPPGTPSAGFVPYILVERVRYRDTLPWPSGFADGLGASIGRINVAAYGNDPANWQAAIKTPGNPFITGGTAPQVTTQPVNAVSPETYSAMFSITATGSEPLDYQWLFNGEPLRAPSSPVLVLNGLKLNQAGQYSCLVFSPGGITVSSNSTLTVLKVATITMQPADRAVLLGSNAIFSVAASSTTPIRYQWRRNGVNIPGATGATYTLNNVQESDNVSFDVVLTDDVAPVVSRSARLLVLVNPQVIEPLAPLQLSVVQGGEVTFGARATGTMPMSFRWRRGGSTLTNDYPNSTGASFYTLRNAQTGNTNISIVITNPANSGTSGLLTNLFILTVLTDTDMDRIPDAFETPENGLDPNNPADAGLDSDGDGLTNLEEYIAGTDHRDAQSYLKVDQIALANGGLAAQLTFLAVSNRTYTVQYRTNAAAGQWRRLADVVLSPSNRVVQVTDPAPGTGEAKRTYRLATPQQP